MTSEKKTIFALLCLGCFTISFNVAAVAAVIPSISAYLQEDAFRVARIISYYLVPYGFGALLYAPLARVAHYRWVFVGTMLLYGIFCLVCGFANDLDTLLFGRVGMGVTAASAIPLGLMLIGDFFERQVRGRLVGIFFSFAFISSIVGLATSGVALWRYLFWIPAGLALLLAVAYLFVRRGVLDARHVGHVNYFRAFTNPAIRDVFIFIFAISFLYHGVHKWYGVFLDKEYGLGQAAISGFFILTVIGGMAGQLTGGWLSDLKGRALACYLGIVGLAGGVMALSGHLPYWGLGVVLTLISVFWTVGHNGISTILTDFSDQDRPVIASLNSSVRFIAGGLGFYVSGIFVAESFRLTFRGISILILLLSLFLIYVVRKHQHDRKEANV